MAVEEEISKQIDAWGLNDLMIFLEFCMPGFSQEWRCSWVDELWELHMSPLDRWINIQWPTSLLDPSSWVDNCLDRLTTEAQSKVVVLQSLWVQNYIPSATRRYLLSVISPLGVFQVQANCLLLIFLPNNSSRILNSEPLCGRKSHPRSPKPILRAPTLPLFLPSPISSQQYSDNHSRSL